MIQQQDFPSSMTMDSNGVEAVEFNQYYSAKIKKKKRNLLLFSLVAILGAVLLLVLTFPLVRKLFHHHIGNNGFKSSTNFHRKHHGDRHHNSIDHHYNSIHLKNRQIHIPSTDDHFKKSHGQFNDHHHHHHEYSSSIIKLFRSALSSFTPFMYSSAKNENGAKTEVKTFLLHFKKNYENIERVGTQEEGFENWLEKGLKKFNVRLGHYIPHRTFMISGSESDVWRARDWINSELSGVSWFERLIQNGEENEICWVGPVDSKDKSVSDDILEVHLDKTVLVDRIMRGDAPYDDAFRYMTRKLLSSTDKGNDVHFIVTASVAKHESKEELEKSEILNENSEIMKRLKQLDIVNVKAVSNSKIAIGVNGHKDAIKVAQDLKEHGLVHWVEVKTPTITHGKHSTGLVQSYKKPTEKPIWNMGITGQGQVIGVGDTGVDYYHCFFYDEKNEPPFQSTLASASSTTSSHRKFKSFWAYMDRIDAEQGHGTHVTGIAAGKAHTASNPTILQEHNSLAQDAKIAFMDAGCDTDSCKCPADVLCECDMKDGKVCPKKFGVVYLPLDLYESYFPYFYQNGARVVSSSWGTGFFKDFGFGYSTNSREIDMFAWEKKDFLPVFAAGNSGGIFGYASLTSEAESKNGVSVGASLNTYQSFEQTVNLTSTQMIIDRLRVELYQRFCQKASDLYNPEKCVDAQKFSTVEDCCNHNGKCTTISSSCCGVQKFSPFTTIGFRCCPDCIKLEMKEHPEYYSQENLAVFTARGPTLDNRIKPDIVTVGEKILSSRSAGTSEARKCGSSEFTKIEDQMIYHEGTSMAAPLAASAISLIRQYYQEGYLSGAKDTAKGFNPSAALVKATLIHSAKPLTGYVHLLSKHMYWPLQYKDGHTFALQSTYMQGFGHIDLSNVMNKSMGLYIPNRQDAQLSTGQVHQYCLNVKSQKTNPLKVTIVWTDPPSSPAAKIHLVNDLDLLVITPSGDKLFGNGGKSSVKQTRDEPDQLNNVEQVELETTDRVGRYNIIVRGNAVTKGPQPYAIVITGDFDLTSGCPAYSFIPYAYLAERVETYSNLSIAFGILSVICIPSLAFLSIYLYVQYRKITTGSQGYRSAEIGQNTRTYVDIGGNDDNFELKNVRKNYETNESEDEDQ